MILITLAAIAVMVFYGIIGYITPVIGLWNKWELYMLIFFYGFVLGAIQSYTRTCFTDIVPPGQESEFFGIFEISDKGSSWLGPTICGVLSQVYGSMRPAFFYLFFMSTVGWYLVYKTDMNEGAEACRRKDIQVRMEAVRKKLGVSKIQIQMNAKKFLGVKSSTASSGASTASSAASTSSVVESEPAKEKSVVEMTKEEIHKEDAMEDAPIDAMLQRASIIDPNDVNNALATMPKRKNSLFAVRSRTTGSANEYGGVSAGAASERRSSRATARKSSLMVIGEVGKAGLLADINNAKVMPE